MTLKNPIEIQAFLEDDEMDRETPGLPEMNLLESAKLSPVVLFSVSSIEPFSNYEDTFILFNSGNSSNLPWSKKDEMIKILFESRKEVSIED